MQYIILQLILVFKLHNEIIDLKFIRFTIDISWILKKAPSGYNQRKKNLILFWTFPLHCQINLCKCAEKDRELGEAHTEIKALKFSERLKEKAVEEVY